MSAHGRNPRSLHRDLTVGLFRGNRSPDIVSRVLKRSGLLAAVDCMGISLGRLERYTLRMPRVPRVFCLRVCRGRG